MNSRVVFLPVDTRSTAPAGREPSAAGVFYSPAPQNRNPAVFVGSQVGAATAGASASVLYSIRAVPPLRGPLPGLFLPVPAAPYSA